jgi:hypothetical protein
MVNNLIYINKTNFDLSHQTTIEHKKACGVWQIQVINSTNITKTNNTPNYQ